jgi:hypothetical protein
MKIKIPTKLHNELFPRRKYNWLIHRYEYNLYDNYMVMDRYITWFAKLLLIVLFPVNVICIGVFEAWKETKHQLFQIKYGSYSRDIVYKKEILDIIRRHCE